MNSQPTKRRHPERMCPFFPVINKNAGPISQLKDSTQVSEQRQRSPDDPNPRQYLVLEAFRQQRPGRRLNRWLGQLSNDRRAYLVVLTDVLGVQHIKRRRQVLIGQMLQLHRDQLAISLGSSSL